MSGSTDAPQDAVVERTPIWIGESRCVAVFQVKVGLRNAHGADVPAPIHQPDLVHARRVLPDNPALWIAIARYPLPCRVFRLAHLIISWAELPCSRPAGRGKGNSAGQTRGNQWQ